MEESHKNNVERNDPDTEEYIPYDPIHIKLKTDKNNRQYQNQNNGYPWQVGIAWKGASGVWFFSVS